jgi:hypothetical protein
VPSLFDRLADAIEAIPGVQGATFSAMPLLARAVWTESVQPDGGDRRDAHIQIVRSNFFTVTGLPMVLGRSFSAQDGPGQTPVAVINARMARELFGDEPAVGRYLTLQTGSFAKVPRLVVGVSADAKYSSVEEEAPATLYLPATQAPPSAVSFEVRGTSDAATLLPAIRDLAARESPAVAVTGAMTMRQRIEDATAGSRQLARLAGGFGLLAVLLACIGLYGVVSYDLTQRVREFGVRLALGASPRDLVALVVRDALVTIGIGSAAGLGIAVSMVYTGQRFFAGVSPLDPLSVTATIVVFTFVALAAVLPPTLKAARIAPWEALRRTT